MDGIDGRPEGAMPMKYAWQKAVDEQATAWVIRVRSGHVSVQEQMAFDAWRSDHPSHSEAYAEALRRYDAGGDTQVLAMQAAETAVGGGRVSRAAIAAVLMLAAAGFVSLRVLDDDVRTKPGEIRSVRLADGSMVQLAGATRLREKFTDAERRVQLLEGQALFQVTRNPERPFKVEAGSQVVQAVGTAFDVSRSDNHVEVAVSEGIVAVATKGLAQKTGVTKLYQGQTIAFEGAAEQGGVRSIPVDQIGAWRQGELIFESVPFARLLEALGRQYGGQFTVDDPALAAKPISVALAPNNKAEAIRLVERALSLRAVERSDGTVAFLATKASLTH
jgi:transmembrane sensor